MWGATTWGPSNRIPLVYSSTNKGSTGKSHTSVVHGLHTSQLLLCPTENCIIRKCTQFHCVNFSKQLCWFKKKMNQCDVPETFLTPCFLTRGHKLLSLVPSLPQLLFSVTPVIARVIFSNSKINSVHISYTYERCKMFILFDLY